MATQLNLVSIMDSSAGWNWILSTSVEGGVSELRDGIGYQRRFTHLGFVDCLGVCVKALLKRMLTELKHSLGLICRIHISDGWRARRVPLSALIVNQIHKFDGNIGRPRGNSSILHKFRALDGGLLWHPFEYFSFKELTSPSDVPPLASIVHSETWCECRKRTKWHPLGVPEGNVVTTVTICWTAECWIRPPPLRLSSALFLSFSFSLFPFSSLFHLLSFLFLLLFFSSSSSPPPFSFFLGWYSYWYLFICVLYFHRLVNCSQFL